MLLFKRTHRAAPGHCDLAPTCLNGTMRQLHKGPHAASLAAATALLVTTCIGLEVGCGVAQGMPRGAIWSMLLVAVWPRALHPPLLRLPSLQVLRRRRGWRLAWLHQPAAAPPPLAASVLDTIGNTPLIRIASLSAATGCEVLGKAEFLNPGGSVKDRVALQIVQEAWQQVCRAAHG